ncbi:MAG: TIGR04076 family protein [Candidatus Bipolaricaulia bacterium]
MLELRIEVERVEGACSGPVPMVPGTGFFVQNGNLVFSEGGPICLFALASILPLIPAKERLIDGDPAADWMGKVQHVQCPDPDGRVIWRVDQQPVGLENVAPTELPSPETGDLMIVVERIEGRCNEGMRVGHTALVRESSLYLAQPFCLYAMQAVLPLLSGKLRAHDPADWMMRENSVVCPDPLGGVILRIARVE